MNTYHQTSFATRPLRHVRRFAALATLAAASATALFTFVPTASAAIVPTVNLATSANYSVLASSTVTNTGESVLDGSVGLSPGTSITGFPPGIVNPPAIIEATTATALAAQADLTIAYVDAANRPLDFTTGNPDLVGLTLIPGVYAAASKAPLGLSGQLVLDGEGNANAVFIFQTDSTLITSSSSSIALINGASECNVFWQVGSSATLGSGSTFVGNILALTSITVETGVTVHGRALARNGAVTLDDDTFTQPSCVPSTETEAPATTTTVGATTSTATTIDSGAVTTAATTAPTASTQAPSPGGAFGPSDTVTSLVATTTAVPEEDFDDTDITLPVTGTTTGGTAPIAGAAILVGFAAIVISRRRTAG